MYYVWFHAFQPGEEDRWVVISKDEYDILNPYEGDLRQGNIPCNEEDDDGNVIVEGEDFESLIYDTIMSRDDADLRPSEIKNILSENIIEIALC